MKNMPESLNSDTLALFEQSPETNQMGTAVHIRVMDVILTTSNPSPKAGLTHAQILALFQNPRIAPSVGMLTEASNLSDPNPNVS
jgi:hypothetical protein